MFSSTKRISEQQLIDEVKHLLGKRVVKHSRATEAVISDGRSLFLTYTWIYTFIASKEITISLGPSASSIVISGNFENSLIEDASRSGASTKEIEALRAKHEEVYGSIASRFNKAIQDEDAHYDPLYMREVSKVAMGIIAEQCTGKTLEALTRENGFDGFSKYLIISKHCNEFYRDVKKLLAKRKLITS